MDDQTIEQEIQAKGLTAPRITPDQIEARMKRVAYITNVPEGTTSTFVHAFLDGKFHLATGHSACVSAENFNAEIGEEIARGKAEAAARDKLWELEGYCLFRLSVSAPKKYQMRDVASYEVQDYGNLICVKFKNGEQVSLAFDSASPISIASAIDKLNERSGK